MVKLAGGIFNTKYWIADGRCEIIAPHADLCGLNKEAMRSIFDPKTTEKMTDILKKEKIDLKILNCISLAIKKRCLEQFSIGLDAIVVDIEGNQLNSK